MFKCPAGRIGRAVSHGGTVGAMSAGVMDLEPLVQTLVAAVRIGQERGADGGHGRYACVTGREATGSSVTSTPLARMASMSM